MRLGAYLFSSAAGIWLLGQRVPGRLMIATWFGKNPKSEDLDWIRNLSSQCPRETRIAVGKATSDLDLRPTFGKPGPPTLLLCGRHDKATPLKFSAAIAAAIADSELIVVENAGHMVIIEAVDELLGHLVTWVD